MDNDVATYTDNDVAIAVAMMTSSQHTQFKDGPKLGNYFTDLLFYSSHSTPPEFAKFKPNYYKTHYNP
jgi:hypothetical protein